MREFEGDLKFLGQNPAAGLSLTYRLKADAKDLKITIADAAGKVVRELSGDATKEANKAGLNTAVWDLRVGPLAAVRGPQAGGGAQGHDGIPGRGVAKSGDVRSKFTDLPGVTPL